MATVKLTRYRDSIEVDVNISSFYNAIAHKRVDSANDRIYIDDETYVFSSIQHNAVETGDVRLYKQDNTVTMQYYDGANWISTGQTWDI